MFEKSKRSLVAATRGGTYRVRDSSVGPGSGNINGSSSGLIRGRSKGSRPKTLNVTVVFLDDSQHTFEVEKSAKGSLLLDKVFQHLELIERDYFGLQFDELLPPPEVIYPLSSPHLRWIESSKVLKKQIRFTKPTPSSKKSSINSTSSQNGGANIEAKQSKPSVSPPQIPSATVYFRVKFFVEDPARLQEEYTRYHVFLQIRKDILENRLIVSPSTACLLASYAVQSELGDFNSEEHDEFGYYLKNIALPCHGPKAEEILRKISQLHKLHRGQTPADAEFNYLDHAKRIEAYGVSFHRVKDNAGKDIEVGVSSTGISVYHNGIKINTFSWSKITKIAFKRKHFFIQLRRESSEEYDTLLLFDCFSYRSCKRLWKSCVEHHAFFRLSAPPPPNRRPTLLLLALGSRFRYSGRTEYQTREDACSRSQSRERERRTFFRSPSKKLLFIRQTTASMHNGNGAHSGERESRDNKENQGHSSTNNMQSLSQSQNLSQPAIGIVNLKESKIENWSMMGKANNGIRACDKVKSSCDKEPRMAWAEQNLSDDEGGFLDSGRSATAQPEPPIPTAIHITLPTKGIAFADDDENSLSDDGTVSIRLEPDNQSKFGFNVKGGFDMGCPVLVSRVAPGTPADQGYPRLNEGDQLIQINGKDTQNMIHREVVNSIRHAATVRKELVLRVRQNVYTTEDYEEPPFQYVPDVPLIHMVSNSGETQSPLSSSMLLLAEAIESDSISSQFELVFRRKPGMNCDVAKLPENMAKNRYRDISPYDSTRVLLQNSPTGDYINANHVKMEIAAAGIVNRYIATQGPLSTTCVDFWVMTWESQSPLIVMLTPICERGRVKCHPYWPQHLNSSVVYHNIQVTTIKEKNLSHWILREFQLRHTETEEERTVQQLQYQSWPDHGVPEDPMSFVRFMEQVREARVGSVDPIIVHCSAGIGRTGVLILMETAECLIEANQPVYPLDIMTQMRVQRPLMIQTSSQYRFVCEAVLKVYQQGIVRPVPEFCMTGSPLPNVMSGRSRPLSSSWMTSSKA